MITEIFQIQMDRTNEGLMELINSIIRIAHEKAEED